MVAPYKRRVIKNRDKGKPRVTMGRKVIGSFNIFVETLPTGRLKKDSLELRRSG